MPRFISGKGNVGYSRNGGGTGGGGRQEPQCCSDPGDYDCKCSGGSVGWQCHSATYYVDASGCAQGAIVTEWQRLECTNQGGTGTQQNQEYTAECYCDPNLCTNGGGNGGGGGGPIDGHFEPGPGGPGGYSNPYDIGYSGNYGSTNPIGRVPANRLKPRGKGKGRKIVKISHRPLVFQVTTPSDSLYEWTTLGIECEDDGGFSADCECSNCQENWHGDTVCTCRCPDCDNHASH